MVVIKGGSPIETQCCAQYNIARLDLNGFAYYFGFGIMNINLDLDYRGKVAPGFDLDLSCPEWI